MNMVAKIKSPATHNEMANAIRALAMDAVEKANSGHPGMPMGPTVIASCSRRGMVRCCFMLCCI